MKILLTIVATVFMLLSSYGQDNTISIRGVVLDAHTRTPLPRATLSLTALSLGFVCDEGGAFQFTLPANAASDSIEISHLGYKSIRRRIGDIREGDEFLLTIYAVDLRAITINSRNFEIKNIDKALRVIRDTLYAFNTETTNGLYNLFLGYLEDQSPALYQKCTYDLSAIPSDEVSLFNEYTKPFRKPRSRRDTTVKDYSEFPVVNISHEAAAIFCQWLTEQYNAHPGKKLFQKVRFRLPTLKEWQVAALGYSKFQSWDLKENLVEVYVPEDSLQMTPQKGLRKTIPVGTDILYPWYGSYYYRRSPQNHKGCFLGNFKVTNPARPCNLTLPGIDGWTKMARTAAYFPNNIGLFDVVGNVAEMIEERGQACGGSWNDPPEKSTIHSVKNYRKPDPSIGFRVFMDVIED